jgi:uncharacterized Zn finger protein
MKLKTNKTFIKELMKKKSEIKRIRTKLKRRIHDKLELKD